MNQKTVVLKPFEHFRLETQANVLWLPPDANYNIRKVTLFSILFPIFKCDFFKEWLDENFKKDSRLNFYIFLSENI